MLAGPDQPATRTKALDLLLVRLGLPQELVWGFVGLLLFMIGDGVESGYLSPYLISKGHPAGNVAWLFTAYGVTAAIAGWLSGALSDVWGPRRVIAIGLCIWIVFEVLFITVGLANNTFPVLLLTYGLRGFGYPLFAFGFLVWIVVAAPARILGSAMGWFWFAFTGGLPTLGSALASWTVPRVGSCTHILDCHSTRCPWRVHSARWRARAAWTDTSGSRKTRSRFAHWRTVSR